LPLWAVKAAVAFGLALQSSVLLTRSPFLPPCMVKTNLETGASGTASKVLRILALTESILPARSTWI
jgi:hypothetical protein